MDYIKSFAFALEKLKNDGAYRTFAQISRQAGSFPNALLAQDQAVKKIQVWCSNDYLGMGQHPVVLEAMHEAINSFGAGSGGTRNISGTTSAHVQLEEELATLHHKESALVFSSGYVANQASLQTLGNKLENAVFFSDEHNHASMIQGIKSSKAECIIFKHNDLIDLENKLKACDVNGPKIIAFESVYSMSGSISPIRQICALAKKYDAFTYLDEVHAVGMYGYLGGGVAQEMGVEDQVDLIQGTLGKAFGLMGGYIAGRELLIDFIRSFASGFIFTTSLPPVIAQGAKASIQVVKKEAIVLRKKHQSAVHYFRACLNEKGIPFIDNPSHIVPVIVGDPVKCKAITDDLLNDYGIYVQPINYPTVRKGTERMRFTPSAHHSPDMIENCIEALKAVWLKHGLPVLSIKCAANHEADKSLGIRF